MNKRVTYTIVNTYLKFINDLDKGSNIKVVYWKLKYKKTPLFSAAKFKVLRFIE